MDAVITDKYAIYNDDCMEVMRGLPDASIDLSVYSPPFAGLYHYSSSERDLSNARDYDEFMDHYEFVIREIYRLTKPGRITAVHCMDIPESNTGHGDSLYDFPGDIIRLHKKVGFSFNARHHIWKEPLGVRNRTMAKKLAHRTIVEDSTKCGVAGSDYLLVFRRDGENEVPVTHEHGLLEYAGSQKIPSELLRYRGYSGKQTENRYSHWIWRQYASANWFDVRIDRVLEYVEARDEDDEKHVHPLQLDVIERVVELYSNPGEVVFTPFAGVGSEVYIPIITGRFGVGVELKETYYRQMMRNLDGAENPTPKAPTLFDI